MARARTTTGADRSLVEELSDLPPEALRSEFATLDNKKAEKLLYDWSIWARPKQMLPPGDWTGWLYLAGRGSGKTRTAAETVRKWVEEAERPIRIAIVAETAADARDVLVLGESGIMAVSPPWNKPIYQPTNRSLKWPNGSQAILFAGEVPDQLRGPQFHKAIVDELAKYRYPQETWDNLEFGLRLGDNPQVIITTTPRPIPIIKSMLTDPNFVVTRGSSYENISNLAPKYIQRVIKKYEGTRLGQQELHADILDDAQGALWSLQMIEPNRVRRAPQMRRLVVGLDPATTSNTDEGTPNETGILVCGLGVDGCGYVLKDASAVLSPLGWARAAITQVKQWHASGIIAERNQGGDMVKYTLNTIDGSIPITLVWASQNKGMRAQPISALSEQNKIKFLGSFPDLENQLTSLMPDGTYLGTGSPDRADAFVWAMRALMLNLDAGSTDPGDYADSRY